VAPSPLSHLRSALGTAQILAGVTLLRSVAYDRWWTVAMAALLIGGAAAARRGRTWGLALVLSAATAFPVAWAIGIAPPWFVFVGIAGIQPFVSASPALARFDRQATALLVGIATSLGALAAIVWKYTALSVFASVPLLKSSLHPHHGWAILTLLAAAVALRLARRREPDAQSDVRIAADDARLRVADGVGLEHAGDLTDEDVGEADVARPARRLTTER
jgi:hypothetical protein